MNESSPRTNAFWNSGPHTVAEMFAFMRVLEREVGPLKGHAEALAKQLEFVLKTTEQWNADMEKIIGRRPKTGIETTMPYVALEAYRDEFPPT